MTEDNSKEQIRSFFFTMLQILQLYYKKSDFSRFLWKILLCQKKGMLLLSDFSIFFAWKSPNFKIFPLKKKFFPPDTVTAIKIEFVKRVFSILHQLQFRSGHDPKLPFAAWDPWKRYNAGRA